MIKLNESQHSAGNEQTTDIHIKYDVNVASSSTTSVMLINLMYIQSVMA